MQDLVSGCQSNQEAGGSLRAGLWLAGEAEARLPELHHHERNFTVSTLHVIAMAQAGHCRICIMCRRNYFLNLFKMDEMRYTQYCGCFCQ